MLRLPAAACWCTAATCSKPLTSTGWMRPDMLSEACPADTGGETLEVVFDSGQGKFDCLEAAPQEYSMNVWKAGRKLAHTHTHSKASWLEVFLFCII